MRIPFLKPKVAPELESHPLYGEVSAVLKPAQTYAQSHGGDIRLMEITDENDVVLQLRGACAMCPLSTITIRIEVEKRLREQVPQIHRIVTR